MWYSFLQEAVVQNSFLHHNMYTYNLTVAREGALPPGSVPMQLSTAAQDRWKRTLVWTFPNITK